MKSEIVVVGAGFAGIFAAAKAALDGAHVTLIEKMPEPISRLCSGASHEMITNHSQRLRFQSRVIRGAEFVEHALKLFSPNKLLIHLEGMGVPVQFVDDEFVFPQDDGVELVKKFRRWLSNCGVRFITEATVTEIHQKDAQIAGLTYEKGGKKVDVETSCIILATGGIGAPGTGATGDGFHFCDELGHHLMPPKPALAPLKLVDDKAFSHLANLKLQDARLYLWSEGKKVADSRGAVIFHAGELHGGAALDLSSSVPEFIEGYSLTLDLLPYQDEGVFDKELVALCDKMSSSKIEKILTNFFPKRLAQTIVYDIAELPKDTTGGDLTAKQRKLLRGAIYRMPLDFAGTVSVEYATDTAGGVELTSINPDTMESFVSSGLYIVGELLDVETRWGGYGNHCAIATGRLAGMSAAAEVLLEKTVGRV